MCVRRARRPAAERGSVQVRKCSGGPYVAVTPHPVATSATDSYHRNIMLNIQSDFRKAIIPLSSFQGRLEPGSAMSQSASASAIASRPTSA